MHVSQKNLLPCSYHMTAFGMIMDTSKAIFTVWKTPFLKLTFSTKIVQRGGAVRVEMVLEWSHRIFMLLEPNKVRVPKLTHEGPKSSVQYYVLFFKERSKSIYSVNFLALSQHVHSLKAEIILQIELYW